MLLSSTQISVITESDEYHSQREAVEREAGRLPRKKKYTDAEYSLLLSQVRVEHFVTFYSKKIHEEERNGRWSGERLKIIVQEFKGIFTIYTAFTSFDGRHASVEYDLEGPFVSLADALANLPPLN